MDTSNGNAQDQQSKLHMSGTLEDVPLNQRNLVGKFSQDCTTPLEFAHPLPSTLLHSMTLFILCKEIADEI